LRIAIFAETFLPKWDGITNTLCYLLDHLAATGHDSLMFAPKGAPGTYARTPIVGLPGFTFPLYPDLRLVPPLVNVRRQLEGFRPDLIHIVNPTLLGLVGLRHARELDLPVVASYHTDVPGYAERYGMPFMRAPLWAYLRWIHNQADLNLCPSLFTRDELVAHRFQRVRIWGRGVDTQRFNPEHRDSAWRHRLSGGHPGAPLLLFAGRLAPEKRVDWLRPLLDAIPRARLAIVGDGPARPELEALFAGTPTVFTGYLQGKTLSCAYAAADLFVFPSASETFGNVVTEAMASGLPIVAARAGGPVDHVRDWETGLLFEPDSVQDLIAKVWQLVSTPGVMGEFGANARAYAETQTWAAVLDGLLKDYEGVIAGHRPKNRRVYSRRPKTKILSSNSVSG
jgi:glycosyltransferase involved in cell wall biosynthesis